MELLCTMISDPAWGRTFYFQELEREAGMFGLGSIDG